MRVTTHIKIGEEENLSFGLAHPLVAAALPLLYIECWFSSLQWLIILLSIVPFSRCSTENLPGLGEALQKYFLLHHHHHQVVVLLEFPVDHLLPLPCWNEGSEVVVKPHVWPSTEALPVCGAPLRDLEVGKWSFNIIHVCLRERYPAYGLRGWVHLDNGLTVTCIS